MPRSSRLAKRTSPATARSGTAWAPAHLPAPGRRVASIVPPGAAGHQRDWMNGSGVGKSRSDLLDDEDSVRYCMGRRAIEGEANLIDHSAEAQQVPGGRWRRDVRVSEEV